MSLSNFITDLCEVIDRNSCQLKDHRRTRMQEFNWLYFPRFNLEKFPDKSMNCCSKVTNQYHLNITLFTLLQYNCEKDDKILL